MYPNLEHGNWKTLIWTGEILSTKYYHLFMIEIEFFVFNKYGWGFGGGRGEWHCQPPNGCLWRQSSIENFLECSPKLVAKLLCGTRKQVCWSESEIRFRVIILEKFQTVINQQVYLEYFSNNNSIKETLNGN